mmetsp:Transcript_889/g.921  ORF Transcript_889/g.921 Transcript_889/m.921 type:complete len:134 (-) Transcript_889:33-434(-)
MRPEHVAAPAEQVVPADPDSLFRSRKNFRSQIVSYLRQQTFFEDKIATCFGGYTQYLDCMSRPDIYGDELTLHAASHLLLRPIVVHSDSDLQPEQRFEPPKQISSDLRGAPDHILHLGQVFLKPQLKTSLRSL